MGVSQRSTAKWYADTSAVLARTASSRPTAAARSSPTASTQQQRGAPDVRPGGLLALARLRGAMPDARRAALARPLAERLVFPYGVASLDQADSLFHPYVDSRGGYSLAAARTEGLRLDEPRRAGHRADGADGRGGCPPPTLFAAQADLLLDRGTPARSPNSPTATRATPRRAPGVGGAPVEPVGRSRACSQPPSRASPARRYASPDTLVVEPHLPEAWGETTLRMRLGGGTRHAAPHARRPTASTRPVVPRGALPGRRHAPPPRRRRRRRRSPLATTTGDTTRRRPRLVRRRADSGGDGDGRRRGGRGAPARGPARRRGTASPSPRPTSSDEYPVTRARTERRSLAPAQVRRDNPAAAVALTQTDPTGDDWGSTSTFTYPEGTAPGALDATYLEVARDDSTTYFRIEFYGPARQATSGRSSRSCSTPARAASGPSGATRATPSPRPRRSTTSIYAGDGRHRRGRAGQRDRPPRRRRRLTTPARARSRSPSRRCSCRACRAAPRSPSSSARSATTTPSATSAAARPATDGGGRAAADSPNVYDVVVGSM